MESRKRRSDFISESEDFEQLYLQEFKRRPKTKAEESDVSDDESFDTESVTRAQDRLSHKRIELNQERIDLEQKEKRLLEEEELITAWREYVIERKGKKLAQQEKDLGDLARALVIEREEFTREQEKLVSDVFALGRAKKNLSRERDEFAKEKDKLETLKKLLSNDLEEMQILRLTLQHEKAKLRSSSTLKNRREALISDYGRRHIVESGEHSGKDFERAFQDCSMLHPRKEDVIDNQFEFYSYCICRSDIEQKIKDCDMIV